MNKIIFLAPFPNEENIKDGMVQRVKHIDGHFEHLERTYLDISLRDHKAKTTTTIDKVTIYKVNAIIHFFFIWKILAGASMVYIHSIYRFSFACIQLLLTGGKKCLDVHGVVPEENKILGRNRFFYLFFYSIEYLAFWSISHVIFVTESMKEHFENKYPSFKAKTIVFNIYPNINPIDDHDPVLKEEEKIIVLYSGNTQAWQNIDEMLTVIKQNLSSKLHYIILTGEPEKFERYLQQHGLDKGAVELKSVTPNELPKYYKRASYGFILRDDNIVNRVANPTKMIEYLMYGIVPIVKFKEIGDFYANGYEYIQVEKFNTNLKVSKSNVNQNVAARITLKNKEVDLKDFLSV